MQSLVIVRFLAPSRFHSDIDFLVVDIILDHSAFEKAATAIAIRLLFDCLVIRGTSVRNDVCSPEMATAEFGSFLLIDRCELDREFLYEAHMGSSAALSGICHSYRMFTVLPSRSASYMIYGFLR